MKYFLIALVAIVVTLTLFKCGKLPSPSTGDEVWWSESGYFLLEDGTLKWPMFDNKIGNSDKTFWPPIVALVQFINFYFFGLTPWSIMIQAFYMNVLLIISCYFCVRKLNYTKLQAGYCSVLLFASFLIERRFTYSRMENWLPIFFFLFCGIIQYRHTVISKIKGNFLVILAGILVGLGAISYYPQTPFFLLACFVVLIYKRLTLLNYLLFALGMGVVLLAWSHWMDYDYTFLLKELKAYKTDSKSPVIKFDYLKTINLGTEILFLVFSILLIKLKSRKINLFGWCCLVSSLSIFVATPATLTLTAALGVASIFLLLVDFNDKLAQNCLIVFGSTVVLLKVFATSFIAFYQQDSRNYNMILPAFKETFDEKSIVGFSQYAWLGLRMSMGKGEIHFMATSDSPQVYAIRSEKLKTREGINSFTHFIVDPRQLESLEEDYPFFKDAIRSNSYKMIKNIKTGFKPLPGLQFPPYQFIIFQKANLVANP